MMLIEAHRALLVAQLGEALAELDVVEHLYSMAAPEQKRQVRLRELRTHSRIRRIRVRLDAVRET